MHGIRDVIIVSHGSTLRAFMMMWLHLNPEVRIKTSNLILKKWFEVEPNPKNASVRVIENNLDQGYIWLGPEKKRQDLLLAEESHV